MASANGSSDRLSVVPPKTVRTSAIVRKSKALSVFQRVQLEKVLGITVTSNAGLACHSATGFIAYIAGCVIVLFDPVNDVQQHLIVPNKRTLSALTFSSDGRYLASGEVGQVPCFRIWDMKDLSLISEVPGHKNGITHLAFSPDSKFLISVGTHHDNLVIVWDWRSGRKVATNKVTCKVRSLAFSCDGSFFVTAGSRHVKFWYLERDKNINAETIPLTGRSAILGDYKDENFLDVICGRGVCAEYTYAVTQSGVLCQFNTRRSLEKAVTVKASAASCVSFGETGVVVGCANGVAGVYDPVGLELLECLPVPHYLGTAFTSDRIQGSLPRPRKDSRYPDCAAIFFDEIAGRIVTAYNDHSFYVWDVRDFDRIVPICSHFFHSRCVWGLDIFPADQPHRPTVISNGSFVTCSSDDTIRIWNVGDLDDENGSDGGRKIDSLSCVGIIYNDPSMQFLCNTESNPGGVDPMDVNADSRYGIRSLRIDPTGQNIAFGDRQGNIHIYELADMRETYKIEAHESEVLCLEFSKAESGYELLASASRDRLIQIFDVKNDYNCLQTLDDHSSSITALRFAALNGARQFGLISCGVDKAVILRTIQYSNDSDPKFVLNDQILSKGGVVYDMDVDHRTQSIVTANQDRQLRIYGIKSRKLEKTVKGTASDEGALIKLDLGDSGRFVATSCSDKNLAVIDLQNGECWATFSGHAEIVTGIKFASTGSRLISVSGDGCVFVWKVQTENGSLSTKNSTTDTDAAPMLSPTNSTGYFSEVSYSGSEFIDEAAPVDIRPIKINLSDGLPSWAKTGDAKGAITPSHESPVTRPGGRWADKDDTMVFAAGDLISALEAVPNRQSPGPSIAFEIPVDNLKSSGRTSPAVVRSSSPANFPKMSSFKTELTSIGSRKEPAQPSILGFLGKQRKVVRDEFDDDDDNDVEREVKMDMNPTRMSPQIGRRSPETVGGDGDSETSSFVSVSTSSPQPSRPETPSEAANKFLNLTTSGIDMMTKGRLPARQSVTIKNRPSLMVTSPTAPVSPPILKSPPVAPSKKLIQSVKLTANRQKFKSTQNLSTSEQADRKDDGKSVLLTELPPVTQQNTQDTSFGMRRATSMMNIGHGELQMREGLDGYNSLLERAKARLAAIAAKTDALSSPNRLSLLSPSSPSRVNGGTPAMTNTSEQAPGPPRRLSARPLDSSLPSARIATLRCRSSDRRFSAGPSTMSTPKAVLENGSAAGSKEISPVSSIRARLNSSSQARSEANGPPSGNQESPTAQAIARIKADLGLTVTSVTSSSSGSTSPVAVTLAASATAKLHCKNLTSALDNVLQRLQTMTSDPVSAANYSEDVVLYRQTLLSAHAKLNPVVGVLAPSSSEEPSSNPGDQECIV